MDNDLRTGLKLRDMTDQEKVAMWNKYQDALVRADRSPSTTDHDLDRLDPVSAVRVFCACFMWNTHSTNMLW